MVFAELQAEKTPEKIKSYMRGPPEWLSVRESPNIIDPELDEIDPGERAAILLAEELSAEGILIDDLAGRIVAADRGLRIIGTLGVLERAGKRGLIDFLDSLDRIKAAGFFISRKLENELRLTNS
jgi:predicted nucleic acid-binding protein